MLLYPSDDKQIIRKIIPGSINKAQKMIYKHLSKTQQREIISQHKKDLSNNQKQIISHQLSYAFAQAHPYNKNIHTLEYYYAQHLGIIPNKPIQQIEMIKNKWSNNLKIAYDFPIIIPPSNYQQEEQKYSQKNKDVISYISHLSPQKKKLLPYLENPISSTKDWYYQLFYVPH